MRFYSKKPQRKQADILIDSISSGKCDDQTVKELKVAVSEDTTPGETERVIVALQDIAIKSANYSAVAYAIKGLMALYPLPEEMEDALERRTLHLTLDKAATSNKMLNEAMAAFLYVRISGHVDRAMPFMGALINLFDERASTAGSNAYNSLMIVAANQPEYFASFASPLTRMLGSINNATRIESARLIAVLATSHPEYFPDAEKTLLHLSTFYPDAEVKSAAAEAYQILSSRMKPEDRAMSAHKVRQQEEPKGGLAEIMRRRAMGKEKPSAESKIDSRLLSLATNFARKAGRASPAESAEDAARETHHDEEAFSKIIDDFSEIAASIRSEETGAEPEAQSQIPAATAMPLSVEESELRDVMKKVEDDFSITAGNILDALGIGYLAKKEAAEAPKPVPVSRQERPKLTVVEPAKKAREEENKPEAPVFSAGEREISSLEFISSIESILNDTDRPASEIQPVKAATAAIPAPVTNLTPATEAVTEPQEIIPVPATIEQIIVSQLAESVSQARPADTDMAEKGKEMPLTSDRSRQAKSPIIPAGVRISAMKFKTIDQTKKPAQAKISIKPHIKPLNRTPLDSMKTMQSRQNNMDSGTVTDTPEVEARDNEAPEYVACPSCNARLGGDSKFCAVCGADVKSPKVRCRKCGEINHMHAGNCTRCGSGLNE